MDIRVGTDIVEVARIARQVADGSAFVDRWFTPGEIAYCRAKAHPERHFAARLAAKEAVFKLLAADSSGPVPWRDIEVVAGESGAPQVRLSGEVAATAQRLQLATVQVSLSHCDDYATATAVALTPGPPVSG